MKQKRKVKSLLPQRKDKKTSFLTTLLLVLSTILCIGSASLLTSSVFAENVTEVTFTGLNDNMEAVYNLKFVDPENLSGDGVADVYVHDNSLYISPSSVIVSGLNYKNEVESGVYSHILGGTGNEIHSENVTIIAGYNNVVKGGKNSTILGGQHHRLETGAVSIGGNHNEVASNKKGVVFIGGNENKVLNYPISLGGYKFVENNNVFILGGEKNKIYITGENMIIGGSGVYLPYMNIGGTPQPFNIFVFSSPKTFTPKGGKAFYLNMENGVGIGTSGVPGGLAVNGALGLLNQGDQRFCNNGNLGVIYSLNGCLIGCTKTSLKKQAENGTVDAPFELLSLNEKCKDKLSNYINIGNEVFYEEEKIPETPNYTGYCIPVDFTGNTRACSTPEVYQNVFFETSIVDNGECAKLRGENKCVFECIDGYHLVNDAEGGIRCYADCELDGKKINHNQTGTRYDKPAVKCSDGEKCKTCANHAKTLICKNGTLYYYSGGRMGGEANVEPLYKECSLYGGYSCEKHGYDLTVGNLVEIEKMKDVSIRRVGKPILEHTLFSQYLKGVNIPQHLNIITNNKTEKSTLSNNDFNWSVITSSTARGYYQLCKDYNGIGDNDGNDIGKLKKPNTNCGTPVYKYKLIGCKTGYTMLDGKCQVKCTSFRQGEGTKTYNPGTILTGYKTEGALCPNECDYAEFECRDEGGSAGVWIQISGGKGGKDVYKYPYCRRSGINGCSGYDIDGEIYKQYNIDNGTVDKTSIYASCQTYMFNMNKSECETGAVRYQLTGCKAGYHAITGENRTYCVSNYRALPCPERPYNADRVISTSYEVGGITIKPGRYANKWDGEWNDKDAWVRVMDPRDCRWECKADHTFNEEKYICEENICIGDEPDNARLIEGSDKNLAGRVQRKLYASESEAAGKPCAYVCVNNYYKKGDKCEEIPNRLCGSEHEYTCDNSDATVTNTGTKDGYYIWKCNLGTRHDECELCISLNANGECEVSCKGDHPDRSQNPLAYNYNPVINSPSLNERQYVANDYAVEGRGCAWTCGAGFELNSDGTGCVESCSGTHPTRWAGEGGMDAYVINSGNNSSNHSWKYEASTVGLSQGCARTCAEGYDVDNPSNPSKCVKKPECGSMSGLTLVVQNGEGYPGTDMSNACPDGKVYPDNVSISPAELNRAYTIGRENGDCGEQVYEWQCQRKDNPSVKTSCSQKRRMAYYDLKFDHCNLTIDGRPYRNSDFAVQLSFVYVKDNKPETKEVSFSAGEIGYKQITSDNVLNRLGISSCNDIIQVKVIGSTLHTDGQGGGNGDSMLINNCKYNGTIGCDDFVYIADRYGGKLSCDQNASRVIYNR